MSWIAVSRIALAPGTRLKLNGQMAYGLKNPLADAGQCRSSVALPRVVAGSLRERRRKTGKLLVPKHHKPPRLSWDHQQKEMEKVNGV
jgi:hypothetical protein